MNDQNFEDIEPPFVEVMNEELHLVHAAMQALGTLPPDSQKVELLQKKIAELKIAIILDGKNNYLHYCKALHSFELCQAMEDINQPVEDKIERSIVVYDMFYKTQRKMLVTAAMDYRRLTIDKIKGNCVTLSLHKDLSPREQEDIFIKAACEQIQSVGNSAGLQKILDTSKEKKEVLAHDLVLNMAAEAGLSLYSHQKLCKYFCENSSDFGFLTTEKALSPMGKRAMLIQSSLN